MVEKQVTVEELIEKVRQDFSSDNKRQELKGKTSLPRTPAPPNPAAIYAAVFGPLNSENSRGIEKTWLWKTMKNINDLFRRISIYDRLYIAVRGRINGISIFSK